MSSYYRGGTFESKQVQDYGAFTYGSSFFSALRYVA